MTRRRVTKLKHFNGTIELVDVGNILVADIEESDALARGEPRPMRSRESHYNGPRLLAGKKPRIPGQPITYEDMRWLPVERSIKYLAKPDAHVCDWRCMGAFKHSECSCECGGRNHGINGRECVAA